MQSNAALKVKNSDCFHVNIPDRLEADDLQVTDCLEDEPVTLGYQLRQILKAKVGKGTYQCPLH